MAMVEKNPELEPIAPERIAHWPAPLRSECEASQFSGIVGTVLVSETASVRVWHLSVPVGGRCQFHRHVNDYFWSSHTDGRARTYFHDGRIVEDRHYVGQTKHFHFERGEFFVHSVENIGDTDLLFTTVEFLSGANEPLPVPDGVRLKPPSKLAA